MELVSYYDFAEDDYQYFMQSYKAGIRANSMGAQAQLICERYMKYLIEEQFRPEDQHTDEKKTRIMRSHNLRAISNFMKDEMGIILSEELENRISFVNGFYFTTRYPGEETMQLSEQDFDKCKEAIEQCKIEIDSIDLKNKETELNPELNEEPEL